MNRLLSKMILLAAFAAGATSVHATTTLQFSVTGTNRATGFSDHAGLAGVDGMRYGMIIDTSGNGLNGGNYDLFTGNTSGFLTVGGIATDDYYFVSSTFPTTSTSTATGTDPGGSGTIIAIANAPNGTDGLISGVTTNDPFALIWFQSATNAAGSYYGIMTDASFLLPSSGSTVAFNTPFIGSTADPIKPANYQFGAVPEPSRMVLAGLGVLGLIARRRRKA